MTKTSCQFLAFMIKSLSDVQSDSKVTAKVK